MDNGAQVNAGKPQAARTRRRHPPGGPDGASFVHTELWRAHIRWMRMRGLNEDTTIYHRRGIMARVADYCGGRPLADLTESDLIDWAESISDLSDATRAVYVSHVRSFYAWAYADHRIPADPAANLPAPKPPQRQPRPISEEDLAAVLVSCTPRVRAWFILAAWAGLRAKEIARLRAENLHLHDDPPYLLVASEATKGRRERVVPLSPYVVGELQRMSLPVRGLCWRKANGETVPPNLVSKLCNQTLHDEGIGDTLHQLRHRFGTQAQRASGNLRVTQELMGHRSPVTTAGYAMVADLDKHRAVAAIPPPITGPDAA